MRAGRCFSLLVVLSVFSPAQTQNEIAEHAQRATAAIGANQSAVAIAELEAWLRLDPKSVTARANLGMVRFTMRDYPAAEREFKTVLSLSPTLWSAKAFLGMCQNRLGDPQAGQAAIQASLPHVEDKRLRSQAGLDLIRSYTETGEIEKAVPVLALLQKTDGDNPDVLYAAYQIHSALAAAALEKLSGSGQDSARVHQVLAQAMMAQDKYPQAIEEYSKAVARDPRLPGLHLGKGEAVLAEGHTEENRRQAAVEFSAEMQIDPGSADAAFQLGGVSLEQSNDEEAKRWLMRAVTIRPKFPDAHVALGEVLLKTGDTESALQQLQLASSQAPENRMAHYHLAQLYKKLGRTDDADREFGLFRRLSESKGLAKPSVETVPQSSDRGPH